MIITYGTFYDRQNYFNNIQHIKINKNNFKKYIKFYNETESKNLEYYLILFLKNHLQISNIFFDLIKDNLKFSFFVKNYDFLKITNETFEENIFNKVLNNVVIYLIIDDHNILNYIELFNKKETKINIIYNWVNNEILLNSIMTYIIIFNKFQFLDKLYGLTNWYLIKKYNIDFLKCVFYMKEREIDLYIQELLNPIPIKICYITKWDYKINESNYVQVYSVFKFLQNNINYGKSYENKMCYSHEQIFRGLLIFLIEHEKYYFLQIMLVENDMQFINVLLIYASFGNENVIKFLANCNLIKSINVINKIIIEHIKNKKYMTTVKNLNYYITIHKKTNNVLLLNFIIDCMKINNQWFYLNELFKNTNDKIYFLVKNKIFRKEVFNYLNDEEGVIYLSYFKEDIIIENVMILKAYLNSFTKKLKLDSKYYEMFNKITICYENFECPILYEVCNVGYKLNCGHIFSYAVFKCSTCPFCRFHFKDKDTEVYYGVDESDGDY